MCQNENGWPVGSGSNREDTSRTVNYPAESAFRQRAGLKAYLHEHGSVSTLEARLRKQGCEITTQVETIGGAVAHQARYQWQWVRGSLWNAVREALRGSQRRK